MDTREKKFGMTLVEVMAVLAITSILAVVSWSVLVGAKKPVNLENACNQVVGSINKARTYALSGKNSAVGSPVVISSGAANSNTYSISGIATPENFSLPRDVTFQTVFACSFAVPSGNKSGVGAVNCADFTIASNGASRTVHITDFYAKCD